MSKVNELTIEEISDVLLGIINKFSKEERKKTDYGIDIPLYHSEIRTITEIKEHEGIHISALAKHCGVTKGAISQVIKKLEQKELIIKRRDIRNQSRFLLHLTSKGEIAYSHYLQHNNEFKKMIVDILQNAPIDKVSFLNDFLGEIKKKL
jgi:DNA-binding MarR family transcriptional regulator